MVGTRIGRWLVTQPLGQGAFATVWHAEDDDGRQGAIKLYRSQQGELAQRAMAEAKALARVSHPNVAEVLDVGAAVDGGWYLVTRFVPSRTLAAELRDHPSFPTGRAVAIARGVARGLQAIHDRNLLHRDVKPSNVLLPEGEPDDAAILIDLGLAGVIEKETGTTAAGQFFGTPAHMAPEQVAAAPQDARTDVWGVGVLLHQMLYGTLPSKSKGSADRGKNLANVLRLFEQIEDRLAKARERPSWLERYEKLVVTATASVALAASVLALRKDLFASDHAPRLLVDGCPTAPVGEHHRLMLAPRWDPAPARLPEKYAWSVDGEPQPAEGVLSWMPAAGAPRTYAIDVIAAGYGRASCVVQVR